MKAIIPIEIGIPTLRTGILEEANVEAITKDLDMVDELREAIAVYSIIPAKIAKPVQQVGKTANIPRRRPSLEKSLRKHG